MSNWSRSEKSVTLVRYVVQAPQPQGSTWNQVQQAIDAALDEYQRAVYSNNTPPDDAIWVKPEDDKIVIFFEKPHDDELREQ